MQGLTHKRGDTFNAICVRTDADGNPVNLTGVAVASQVRRIHGGPVDDLTTAVIDASAGSFSLSATATMTNDWPIATLLCDVEFTDGANVISTDTFQIEVIVDITR